MCAQRVFIFLLCIIFSAFAGCRKNSGSAPITVPRVPPRTDSVPQPPPPPATHSLKAIVKDLTRNIGGFYEALPPAYDTSHRYPLLVFLHGGGERGNGNSELPWVLQNALPKLLAEKKFPTKFNVSGVDFSFIVIAPQFKEWPKPSDVHSVIDHALENYSVDRRRVYLSGLSMGGGATWEYAAEYGDRLAAIVPICGASWPDTIMGKKIAATGVPSWSFHNIDDAVVPVRSTTRYIEFINLHNPVMPPKVTLWDAGGHDAWTLATDPSYREDNKNIYEWMLQYLR